MNKKECIDYLKNFDGNKAKLAKEIGIAIGTFYRIIKSKKIRSDTVSRISRYAERTKKKSFNNVAISMNIDDLWQYIDPRIKCICKDKNGDIYGYETIKVSPNLDVEQWRQNEGDCYAVCLLVDFSEFEDWTEMKYIRPNCYEEYIGKYGVFSTEEKGCLTVLGALESVDFKMNMPFKRKNGLNYKYFRPLTEEEKGNLC